MIDLSTYKTIICSFSGGKDCWRKPEACKPMPPRGWQPTCRDYFAASMMNGLLCGNDGSTLTQSQMATEAVQLTDALIKELDK